MSSRPGHPPTYRRHLMGALPRHQQQHRANAHLPKSESPPAQTATRTSGPPLGGSLGPNPIARLPAAGSLRRAPLQRGARPREDHAGRSSGSRALRVSAAAAVIGTCPRRRRPSSGRGRRHAAQMLGWLAAACVIPRPCRRASSPPSERAGCSFGATEAHITHSSRWRKTDVRDLFYSRNYTVVAGRGGARRGRPRGESLLGVLRLRRCECGRRQTALLLGATSQVARGAHLQKKRAVAAWRWWVTCVPECSFGVITC